MTEITAHGAVLSVTGDGVHVRRTPMGQTLLPAELTVAPAELRGWYHHAPTATSPGWIQFSLAHPPAGSVVRPLRGYPATHGVDTVVAFAPGQTDAFVAANSALTALQGGYPVEAAAAAAAVTGTADATGPAAAGTAADTGAAQSGAPGNPDAAAATSSADGTGDAAGAPLSLFELPAEPATTGSAGSAGTTASSGKSGGKGRGGRGGRGSWKRVSTPDVLPEPDLTADADNPVFGQNVTVTGDFEPYGKGEVWDMIAAAGGTVGKNVTKKTTVLVVGTWDSMTGKEKKARELQEKKQDIRIWSFAEFLEKIGKTPRPEFSEVQGTDAPF